MPPIGLALLWLELKIINAMFIANDRAADLGFGIPRTAKPT